MIDYKELIKPLMSDARFKHSLNVAISAEKLAMKYGADVRKAGVCGILHDITKEFSIEKQLELASKYNIKVTEFERASSKLFHAATASEYIKEVAQITDSDIINAVKYHTTARAGMSKLEKIIFVADFISEDRDYAGVSKIRQSADKSLQAAFMEGLIYSIESLLKSEKPIHPNTFEAYNEAAFERRKNSHDNP